MPRLRRSPNCCVGWKERPTVVVECGIHSLREIAQAEDGSSVVKGLKVELKPSPVANELRRKMGDFAKLQRVQPLSEGHPAVLVTWVSTLGN